MATLTGSTTARATSDDGTTNNSGNCCGWLDASTSGAWSATDNRYSQCGDDGTYSYSCSGNCLNLKGKGFNFTIPEGATITGIMAEIKCGSFHSGGWSSGLVVKLTDDDTTYKTKTANLPYGYGTGSWVTLGGTGDTWSGLSTDGSKYTNLKIEITVKSGYWLCNVFSPVKVTLYYEYDTNEDTSISVNSASGETSIDTVDLTATLFDENSDPMDGKSVTFKLDGTSLGTATTDVNGVATKSHDITEAEGEYEIEVDYAGETGYNASVGYGTLTVTEDLPPETSTHTDWLLPTATSQYSCGSATDWEHTSRLQIYDGVATTDASANVKPKHGDNSQCLVGLRYNANIPDGAEINGIEVSIGRKMAGSVVSIYDYQVYLFYNGNKIGTNKADIVAWTQTYYEKTYGTYNSTWGATLTSTIVNDDSFGVMLQVKNDNTTWDVDAYVDSIRIRVYYTTIASYTMGVSFPIYLTDNLLSEDCDCTDIDGLSWTGSYAVGPAGEGVLEDQPSDLSTVHPLRPVGTLKTVGYVGPFQLYIPNLLDGLNVSRKDSPLASAYRGTNALGKRMQVVDERSFDVVVPTGTDFEMMGLVDMNEIVPIDGSQFVDENEAMTMRGFAYVYGINPRYHNPQFSKITVTTDIFTHINSRLLFDHTTGLNDGTRLNMTYTPTSLDSQYEMKTGLSEFTTYFNKVQKSDGFAAAGFDVDPAKKCLVVTSVCETLNQYAYMTSSFKQDMTAPFYAEADIFVATSATATKSSDQNCLDAAVNYEVMARDFKIMIAAVDKWLVDHADVPPEIVYIRKGGVKQPTYVSWAKYNYDMLVRWDNWFTHYGSEANFVWINNPDGNNTNLFGPSEVIHTSDGKIKSIYIHTDDYTDIDTAVLEDAGITDVYVHSRYETSPSYTLVLPYVIDLLEGTGIRVHAWINAPTGYHPTDTSTNTTVQTLAATIVSDYDVAGIVLDGFRWDGSTHISHNESPDGNLAVQTFHKNVYNAVKSADSSKTVTISIKAEITKTHSPHYDSDYYYGQNYALLAPYCDILAPMTYVGDYAYEADPWIDDVVTFIRQYTSKPIVPVLETYITGTSNSKSQATLITEAEIALQHGAGFGLFRYGLIDNNNFPTAASDVTVVLPSDVGVGTGLFIGNKDIGLTPESTSGIRVRLITQSDGNYVEVDTYNSGVYSNLTGTPLGMSITGCKIKVLIDAENKATVWYNTGSNDVKVVDRVNSQIGQIEDIIVALFADSMTNVDYYHGYNNFNFYTPTYDDGGSTTTDDSAYNVIIAPPGDMNVTPNFYRTSRYGPLPCYINYGTAVTQKPLSFKIDPRDYYDGAVKLWDGGTKVYNTNHNWYDRSNETYNPVSMDNGFTRLDVDIENNIIEFYGYVGGWNLINTFSIGTINEVKPILISSEEITLRINDTYWNLKRGKPHLLIDHRYTDISYTAKQYYFHGDEDGNLVADQISGVNQAVSMDSCFYACVYNTSDRYRLQIMKVNKEYPIKNDRIPADSTTGIGWYDRDESNPLDKYDFRAKEWIYQPQTNIEY